MEHAPDIALIEAEPFLSRAKQAHDLGMLDHHALRLARGAGGVDHIGEVLRGDSRLRIVLWQRAVERCIGVEHAQRSGISQRFTARGICEQQPWCGVGEDVAQTLARIRRIERHVSAPGLEDCEQRDDHADAALHAQRHTIFRIDALRDQMMRKLVGAGIEFRIGERLVFEDQRDCFGCALNLLLEELMDAQIRRIGRTRVVPRFDEQGAGLGRQHVELVHRRLRRVLERLREARKRLLHVPAQLLGRQRRDGLRGESEAVAVVVY
ncbi:hypothetical protein AWB81_06342 [Caballeronia arationis]|nr:hypothetical protein AWB81_06342 [Caballeronia arationis]